MTLAAAIKTEIAYNNYFKVGPLSRPDWFLYMQNNGQGAIHGVDNENNGDQTYFFFTEHPGNPGYYVITNRRW